jgi:peptidyl-dipeptidase Dcp
VIQPPHVPSAPNPAWEFVEGPPDLTLPDFQAITPQHLIEAAGLAVRRAQDGVADILSSAEDPTFHTVTLALERALQPADSLSALVRVFESNVQTDAVAEAAASVWAQLTSLRLGIELDQDLYELLQSVPTNDLIPEDRRLHDLLLQDFVRAGVRLQDEDRRRVSAIATEIDRIETEFGQLLLREASSRALVVPDEAALAGLDEDALAAARADAQEHGAQGLRLPLTNTTQQDALTRLTDPQTRRHLLALSTGRGSSGGPGDTRELITDLTALRAALAAVLGFQTFAQYSIDDQVAPDVESAGGLLRSLIDPALTQFAREARRVRAYFDLDEEQPLERADVLHLWERYRTEAFELDSEHVAAHFEFERVLTDGVFATASALYGLTFVVRDDLSGWHDDVRVHEVQDRGRPLGLVLIDPYARTGKSGGAWMDELVTGSRLTGLHPITTLTLNVPKPAAGRPALLSVDETITLFHEFGHVLHGLFADSVHPSHAGTSVPRDYVEFPSQQFEMWALHPQVVPGYARHWETDEALDPEVIETLRDAQGFGQGFETLEYLAAAMLDLGWHALEDGEEIEDVLLFEAEVLSAAGFDPVVPPRYRSTYFAHTFTGGYASGYYSYLWSEQYAAAVTELFEDHGGLDPELGARYRKQVLAPGYSVDPLTALRDFLGADVEVEPLLRRRGLAPTRPAGPAHPAHARLERALRAAGIDSRVIVHPEPLPTAAAAAVHHGVEVGAIANSLVFTAEFEEPAAEAGETPAAPRTADGPGHSPGSGQAGGPGEATAASAEGSESADAPQVREEPVLIMTSGAHRVDTKHTAAVIGARRLKRATPEQVLAATGQPVGGVAPAGHPAPLRTFIDRDLRLHTQLWAGGGTVEAMVPLTYTQLVDLTGGQEIDVEPH